MSSEDIAILMAPFTVLFVGMIIAFSVHHYNTIRRG